MAALVLSFATSCRTPADAPLHAAMGLASFERGEYDAAIAITVMQTLLDRNGKPADGQQTERLLRLGLEE